MGDKASQTVGTVKDVTGTAEGWIEDGAHAAYKQAADVKDGTYNAAAAAGHKAGSTIRRVSFLSYCYISNFSCALPLGGKCKVFVCQFCMSCHATS